MLIRCWTVIKHHVHRIHHHIRRGIHHLAAHKTAAATATVVCVAVGGGAWLQPPVSAGPAPSLPAFAGPLGPPIDFLGGAGAAAFGPAFAALSPGEFASVVPVVEVPPAQPTLLTTSPVSEIETLAMLPLTTPSQVPEPSTFLLFVAAVALLIGVQRRRHTNDERGRIPRGTTFR